LLIRARLALSLQLLLGATVPAIHARCSPLLLERFLFSLRRFQMASGGELGRSTGTAVVDTWSQARLQEFADKAAQEKAYLIRKRLGDQHIQVSCKYHALV
jgi:hypothetical protein